MSGLFNLLNEHQEDDLACDVCEEHFGMCGSCGGVIHAEYQDMLILECDKCDAYEFM